MRRGHFDSIKGNTTFDVFPETADVAAGIHAEASHFDAMFDANDDPWRFRTRWYERRKRALILAFLPHLRYRRAFEPGCANGELTAALATRCDSVVAWDISAPAIAIARRRIGPPHVVFERAAVPAHWPDGRFDLVVTSEVLYYLSPLQQRTLALLTERCLAPGGVVLACHWRRRLDDAKTSAADAHVTLAHAMGLAAIAHYDDADMLIDVWSNDPHSVFEREDGATDVR